MWSWNTGICLVLWVLTEMRYSETIPAVYSQRQPISTCVENIHRLLGFFRGLVLIPLWKHLQHIRCYTKLSVNIIRGRPKWAAKLPINTLAKECLTQEEFCFVFLFLCLFFLNRTINNINISMYPLNSMQKSQHQLIKQYANKHTA